MGTDSDLGERTTETVFELAVRGITMIDDKNHDIEELKEIFWQIRNKVLNISNKLK